MRKTSLLLLLFVWVAGSLYAQQGTETDCELPSPITYDTKVIGIDEWHFKLQITIRSKGATDFVVSIMDWEENFTASKIYEECDSVTSLSPILTYHSRILLSFIARNECGEVREDVILSPFAPSGVAWVTNKELDICRYRISDLKGTVLLEADTWQEIQSHRFATGVYLVMGLDKEGRVLITEKMILKN